MKNTEVINVFVSTYRNKANPNTYKTKNLFFDDNILYSYGYHYPLCVKLADNNFIINKSGYSMTTSTHTNHLIRTITNNNSMNLNELIKLKSNNYPIILMTTEQIKNFINFIKYKLNKDIKETTSQDLGLMEIESEVMP